MLFQDSEVFDDVAVQVSEKEWASLKSTRKALYTETMVENYRTVASLGESSLFLISVWASFAY